MYKAIIILICGLTFTLDKTERKSPPPYHIHIDTVYHTTDTLFLQARTSIIKNGDIDALLTQSFYGMHTHSYGDVYTMVHSRTKGWQSPQLVNKLIRHKTDDGLRRAFGDVTPEWHQHTQTVLCTGKSFFSYPLEEKPLTGNQREDIEHMQEIAYAVYYPQTDTWSSIKVVALPDTLTNGDRLLHVNAGCTQRYDMPNGDVLLPIRYMKGKNYVSTTILCSYDGRELKYKQHGSSFTVPAARGLYEPSITYHKGEYFLTMRGDESAYVAKSKDGLHYQALQEWKYNDGQWLGSYNTQQHWISNKHGLFLVYTRKGANNDKVFRHRAPLFIAQVDPSTLTVVKDTEKVLIPIPEGNGDLGNFGVTHLHDNEAWVTVSVMPQTGRDTNTLIAKVKWDH